MNIKEYLKDKNVLSIDIWVFIIVLLLFPKPISEISDLKIASITPGIILPIIITNLLIALLVSLLFIAILLFCSKLRNYRYLDIYTNCKRLESKTSKIILILVYLSLIPVILISLWLGISFLSLLYITFMVLITMILSLHLNNSKDFRINNNTDET